MSTNTVNNYYRNRVLNEQDNSNQDLQNNQQANQTTDNNNQSATYDLRLSGSYNKYLLQTKYEQDQSSTSSTGPKSATDASNGTDAANILLDDNNYKVDKFDRIDGITKEQKQAEEFARVMHDHAKDPEYLKEFVAAIPPEKMAQLVAKTGAMSDAYTNDGQKFDPKQAVANGLAIGLEGVSDPTAYAKQFAAAATQTGSQAAAIEKIIEQLPSGAATDAIKQAFMSELVSEKHGLAGRGADSLDLWERAQYAQSALDLMSKDPALAEQYKSKKSELESNAAYLKFSPNGNGPVDPNGLAIDAKNGEEAAARLMNQDNKAYWGPEKKWQRENDFIATIQKHQNEPEFIAQMLKHLSPDEAAKLLSAAAVHSDGYRHDTDQRFDPKNVVVKGLADASKYMTGDELKAIADAASKDPVTAMQVATLLSRDTSANLTDLKRALLDGMMKDGRALGNPGDNFQKQVDSYIYARAAGKLMGSDAKLAHEYLGKDGVLDRSGKRGEFLKNAIFAGANSGEVGYGSGATVNDVERFDGLGNALGILSQEDFKDVMTDESAIMGQVIDKFKNEKVWSGGDQVFASDYGGLLKNLAGMTDANGNLTPQALKLFYDSADRASEDASVRDALATVFMQHTDQIMKDILVPGIGQSDGNRHQFEKFLYSILFTEPKNATAQSQTLKQGAFLAYGGWMANIHSDLIALSDKRFEEVHGQGWTRQNAALYLGRAMGLMNGALEKASQNAISLTKGNEFDIRNVSGVGAEVVLQGTGLIFGNIYNTDELVTKRNIANGIVGVGLRVLTSWVQTALIDQHNASVTSDSVQRANDDFQRVLTEKYNGNIVSFIADLNAQMEDTLEPLNTTANGDLAAQYKNGHDDTVNDPYWGSLFQH